MKRLKQWIAALCMTVSMTMTAFGGQWMQDSSGWWYLRDDGSYPASSWQWIDGNGDGLAECYYFNENGYCLMNQLTPDGLFVDANGALVIGGVVQTQAVVLPGAGNASNWQNMADAGLNGSRAADTDFSYPVEEMVWLSATGEKYHRIPNCGRMNPNKARQVSLDEAIAGGYERCKNCY